MFARVRSAGVLGVDAYIVEVETDLEFRLPCLVLVGLAEGAVRESRERVISAIKNTGYSFPQKKVTVNLAPADIKKDGSGFDLPIAVGVLAADGRIPVEDTAKYILAGELSLDGGLKSIKGVLPIAMKARAEKCAGLIVPAENAREAALVEGLTVYPASNLGEVADFLAGDCAIEPYKGNSDEWRELAPDDLDFSEVKGQAHVKRALEIAAAGSHNVLMIGPPGSGKTMLARRIPGILPEMTIEEALETTKIHSVAGILEKERPMVTIRPFRDPHHTISEAALIGGGGNPRPGEVSMAHNGVLFLDELPEMGKKSIELLRQPLEDGKTTISRVAYTVSFPASFMLVAAMNPCPCGHLGDTARECTCSPFTIQRYLSRISGPILDRIDIHVEVPAIHFRELSDETGDGERSAHVRERVNSARQIQRKRYSGVKGVHANAHIGPRAIRQFCGVDEDGKRIFQRAMDAFGFSARVYHRILKVSRTIADLAGEENISSRHIAEAVQYRTLDRKIWRG